LVASPATDIDELEFTVTLRLLITGVDASHVKLNVPELTFHAKSVTVSLIEYTQFVSALIVVFIIVGSPNVIVPTHRDSFVHAYDDIQEGTSLAVALVVNNAFAIRSTHAFTTGLVVSTFAVLDVSIVVLQFHARSHIVGVTLQVEADHSSIVQVTVFDQLIVDSESS